MAKPDIEITTIYHISPQQFAADTAEIGRRILIDGRRPTLLVCMDQDSMQFTANLAAYLEVPVITRNPLLEGLSDEIDSQIIELVADGNHVMLCQLVVRTGGAMNLLWDQMYNVDASNTEKNVRAVCFAEHSSAQYYVDYSAIVIEEDLGECEYVAFPWEPATNRPV